MNIALIGCGKWGSNIYQVLLEQKLLYRLYDLNKVKPEVSADSLEAILNDPAVDGVVIATPVVTHYEIAKKVLEAKKPVLVEKPFVLNSKDARELVRLADHQKVILMVGHLLHYHPAIIKLKELIADGNLGELRYIYSDRLNFGQIRTEENVWWSFAPHDISIILSLIGKKPERVYAFGSDLMKNGIADMTLTIMNFDSVTAHIHVSWFNPSKVQRLAVIGSKGSVVFDGVENELTFYQRQNDVMVANAMTFGTVPALTREIEHFVDCIKFGRIPLTDGKEGQRVVEVLEEAIL